MTFPNAHEGVKKIRTAELLYLIIAIGGFITAIMITVATASKDKSKMTGGLAVLATALGIIAIVAFIINLIGLSKASKDDRGFKDALIFTLVGIILGALSSVFSKDPTITGVIDVVSNLINVLVMVFVVRGIMNLATKLGRNDMIDKGNGILKKVVVVHVIGLVINLIGTLLQRTDTVMTIAAVLLLVAGVIDVIVYFAYLKYLGKAVVMLEQ